MTLLASQGRLLGYCFEPSLLLFPLLGILGLGVSFCHIPAASHDSVAIAICCVFI